MHELYVCACVCVCVCVCMHCLRVICHPDMPFKGKQESILLFLQ